MADQAIDYAALAEQARKAATPSGGIDYSAMADQARGGMLEPIGYRNGMPVFSVDVYGRPTAPSGPPVFQGTDEQGRPIMAPPPGPPPAPMPWALQGRPEPIARNFDPRTGELIQTPAIGTVPLLDNPFTGTVQAIGGYERVRGAKSFRDVAGGTSEMIRGTLEAATPILPGAFAGAPLATAITLATGTGLSAGSEYTMNKLGIPKEYSALTSDLIGLFGAGWAHRKLVGLAKLPYLREAAALEERLNEATRRAQDPNATEADKNAARAQIEGLLDGIRQAEAGAARQNILPQVGIYRAPGKPYVKNQLNPIEQASEDYLRARGINTPLSMQTADPRAAHLEGAVRQSIGGGYGNETREQIRQQVQGLGPREFGTLGPELTPQEAGAAVRGKLAGDLEQARSTLTGQVSPTPSTPEQAGGAVGKKLAADLEQAYRTAATQVSPTTSTPEIAGTKVLEAGKAKIREYDQAADESYKAAWKAAEDPRNVERVAKFDQDGKVLLDDAGNVVTENMALPVDMGHVQTALKPLADEYEYTLRETDVRASLGLKAMRNIINGPRFKPLPAAEKDLGMLLEAARTENLPELRDTSQGLAAASVKQLKQAINEKMAQAQYPGWNGEGTSPALRHLQSGRLNTAKKYEVADIFKPFGRNIQDVEPVSAFKRMTWAGDAGIEHLREVATIAPQHMPEVGRAFIDGGGNWKTLGAETKKILFKDPELIKQLDQYYAKKEQFGPLTEKEPVALFKSLIASGDAGINQLREVAKIAPEHMPEVGRAFIDAGGKWKDLGPETKKILFKDPELIKNLDDYYTRHEKFSGLTEMEPVDLFDTLTAPRAKSNELLSDVAQHAPEQMPGLLRAFVGELWNRATREGDFKKVQSTLDKWLQMDPKSKALMTNDPSIVRNLDNLFFSLKRLNQEVNPSGSGYIIALNKMKSDLLKGTGMVGGGVLGLGGHGAQGAGIGIGAGYMAGAGAEILANKVLARFLFDPRFTRLLTEGIRMQLRGNDEGARLIGKSLSKMASEGPPPEGGPPLGGPSNPPGAPPGSTGGGAAPEQTPGVGQRIKEALKRFWEEEEGSQKIPWREEDYSKHQPPPEGEPVSPLKPLQPPEIRRYGELQGSLHELRRAAERKPGVGGPDNERTVFSDDKGDFVVGKITPQDWIDRVNKNLSADEMVKARKWYRELEGFFNEQFGEKEGPKMALAWLSSQQNVSPSGGMTNVLRAMDQLRGLPKEKVAGLAEAKILAALKGDVPEGGYGAKLNDFVDSAMGKTTRTWMGDDPRGGQPAVIDVWANRDVGKLDQKMIDYLTERFGSKAVKKLKIDGATISETDYDYGSKFYNRLVNYLNKTGFDGGGWTGDQVQAVGWTAMQKALGATPEFASDLISKNTRRYGYEIHPGEGAPILQKYPWDTLSVEQQAKVTEYVGKRVTDLAAELTGAKVTNRQVTRGAYLGQPTISVQMDVFASPETFRDFGRAAGYLGQQSEVWHVRPLKTGNSWAYSIRAEKGLDTPEVQQQFWEKLRDRVGADLVPGYSPMGGDTGNGIFIVNPFNRKYLFERTKAGFKNPTSMRNWTAADKAKIWDGIEAVEEEMGLNLEVGFDKVDLGASLHNWARKGKQNGHLQRLVETGRSDLANRLSDHAPEALQSWWKEAWDQFAAGGSAGPSEGLQEPPTRKGVSRR